MEPDLQHLLAARSEPAAADPADADHAAAAHRVPARVVRADAARAQPDLSPTSQDIDKLAQGTAGVDWTHAGDLVNIYGIDADGYAADPWDNVGVQYGLQALLDGMITPEEFLDLNAQGRAAGRSPATWWPRAAHSSRMCAEPCDLRPLELAQHESVARRRDDPRAATRAAASRR